MIHLSACNMDWGGGGGGVGQSWLLETCDDISQCFNFLLVLLVGMR